MLPILFKIGPITIYSFGFFLTLAYLAATFILWREGKRQGYQEEKLLDLSVVSLIAAIIGGRINFVLLNWSLFQDEPATSLFFWQGGFAYYGALVAVLLVGCFLIRAWKWSFFQVADIAAIAASIALVFGKTGTFLAGMDFGRATDLPWAVNLPGLVGARHPAQLYEAGGYFLIFVFLYVLYFRNLASPNMKSGKVFFSFLVLTSLARGFLEFFRANQPTVLSWPIASLVSVAIATASLFALYYFQIRDIKSDLRAFLKGFLLLNSRVLRKIRF